jgi:CHAT domain
MPLSQILRVATGERLPVRIGSNSSDTQVNAEIVGRVVRGLFNYIHSGKQVPFALAVNQIGFTLSGSEQNLLSLTTNKWNLLSAGDRPNRTVVLTIAQNPVVKSNRTVLMKCPLSLVVKLIGVSYFSDYSHGELSGNIELVAKSRISELVDVKLAESFMLPRYARAFIGRCVGSFNRLFQQGSLFFSRIQLQSYRQFHGTNYSIFVPRLPAELVVLSACQTGLGKEIRGEGLVGLARGFIYAGAARVMASLWQVNDAATAELMRLFYRRMLQEGMRPAAALRAAQIEMWKRPQWESPYYWGAFVLQGEWR